MTLKYAVVLKTYTWDEFVHRQALRCQAAAPSADFFISVDETNGSVGSVPFDRVERTTCPELIALGFANRFESGSLLWWNADYVHYQFQQLHPEYDYYVFVEYDAVMQTDLDSVIEKCASLKADFVSLPIETNKDYFWTLPHLQTYPKEDLRASLMCISICSPRALKMLAQRRHEMAADANTKYWPAAEIFMETEIGRAGYNARSIQEFGDTSRYVPFPPMLEQDIPPPKGPAFLHPILDKQRYVKSVLNNSHRFRSFFNPLSSMYKSLRPIPLGEYALLLPAAAKRRLRASVRQKSKRFWLQVTVGRKAG